MILFTFILISWLLCGVLSYALINALWHGEFSTSPPTHFLLFILGGPIDLIITTVLLIHDNGVKHTFKYGIKLY